MCSLVGSISDTCSSGDLDTFNVQVGQEENQQHMDQRIHFPNYEHIHTLIVTPGVLYRSPQLTCSVFVLSVSLSSVGSYSSVFTSQITLRTGQQRRGVGLFILRPTFPVTDSFGVSPVWQEPSLKIFFLGYLFLPVFPHCSVLLAVILHAAYCQRAKILHWQKPQRDVSHESTQITKQQEL